MIGNLVSARLPEAFCRERLMPHADLTRRFGWRKETLTGVKEDASIKLKASGVIAAEECPDQVCTISDQLCDNPRRLIAATQPHHFGRRSAQHSDVGEVHIERDDGDPLAARENPDRVIARPIEPDLLYLF